MSNLKCVITFFCCWLNTSPVQMLIFKTRLDTSPAIAGKRGFLVTNALRMYKHNAYHSEEMIDIVIDCVLEQLTKWVFVVLTVYKVLTVV